MDINLWSFLYFFSDRLLSVLRGNSFFSSRSQHSTTRLSRRRWIYEVWLEVQSETMSSVIVTTSTQTCSPSMIFLFSPERDITVIDSRFLLCVCHFMVCFLIIWDFSNIVATCTSRSDGIAMPRFLAVTNTWKTISETNTEKNRSKLQRGIKKFHVTNCYSSKKITRFIFRCSNSSSQNYFFSWLNMFIIHCTFLEIVLYNNYDLVFGNWTF